MHKDDTPVTARPAGDGPLTGLPQEVDEAWVSVRPDNGNVKRALLLSSPVVVLGAARVGLMMAQGRGTSEGSGSRGLVIGLLAVLFPFVWIGLLGALRWANAGIVLDEGVLTVRNRFNRRVLRAPVSALTGLHQVDLPIQGPHSTRIVITAHQARPVMIDPRTWDARGLAQLWHQLPVPLHDSGFLEWREVKQRFPKLRRPWHHVHYGLFVLLGTVGTLAYIALVVNLPFLL
ncbi:hypothetical protein AB0K80_07680 [Streptomyces sp. NPDC052682]|uniref:hypothetical protein n=1 Tax=Streptomyces sp. NPDC052682 TaxID=3154954 RepID=UPI00343CE423